MRYKVDNSARTNKLKDTFMTTLVAGSIGTAVQMIISWSLYLLKITNRNTSLFHAMLLTDNAKPNLGEIVLGVFSNFGAGIFFALFVVYFLRLTGFDYAIIKGAFIGVFCSMFQFIFLARLFKNPSEIIPDTMTMYQLFVGYIFWGIITAYITKKYSSVRIIKM